MYRALTIGMLLGASLGASSALADLRVISRVSSFDSYSYYSPGPGPVHECSASISTEAFGLWNVDAGCGRPNQYVYEDPRETPMGGSVRGSGSSRFRNTAGDISESFTVNTLQVRFDIVDEPTEIRLAFTGDEYPWMPFMTVLNNTRFRIMDMTTGQYVFELLRDGNETNRNGRLRWAQQTWASTLPVGQYRLEMRGSGDAQYDAGGGSDYAPYGNGGVDFSLSVTIPECEADFNGDGFVDFFDYNDFVACFEMNDCPAGRNADFNGDGFADFFDYADYVAAFEAGC